MEKSPNIVVGDINNLAEVYQKRIVDCLLCLSRKLDELVEGNARKSKIYKEDIEFLSKFMRQAESMMTNYEILYELGIDYNVNLVNSWLKPTPAKKQKVKEVVSEAMKYMKETDKRTQEAIITIKIGATMRILDAKNALKTFKRINQYAFQYHNMLVKPKEMFLQKKNKKEKEIASIKELFDVLAKCDKDDKIFIVGRK